MSKGSPVVKCRVKPHLVAAIEADIIRLNRLPQHGAMTVTEWLLAAIAEKLDHPHRSRKAGKKRRVSKQCKHSGAIGSWCGRCNTIILGAGQSSASGAGSIPHGLGVGDE